MATTERDLLYRAKFVDDVSSGVTSMTAAWDRGFEAMTRAVRDGNSELVKIQAQLGKTREAGKSAGESMAQGMSTALPSVQSVTDALGAQVAQLRAQAAAMKTPEHQAYARAQQALRAEIEALTRSASNQNAAIQSTSSSLGAAQAPTRSLSASWTDLAGKWFLASQAMSMVSGAVSSLTEDSAKWQMMRNSISDTEGSASKAATTIKELVEVAKLPGLDLQPLSKGYVGFRSLNIEGEEAVRTMKAFGNAIALAGGGANDFERVNRQILQMLGKGSVLQEDISIIAESMPRIRELTKEAFGTYDIEKIRESGVTANEFVDAVVAAAEKLPPASGNIKNSLDNASTAMSQFRDQLLPDEGIQGAVDGWTNEMEAFTALFKAIASPVETAKGAIAEIRAEMYRTSGMTSEWLASQKRARDLYGIKDEPGSTTVSGAMAGSSFATWSAAQAKKTEELAKKQGAALTETNKALAKSDLAVALQIEREKWTSKLALFQEGSESYKQVLRAQLAEEARIRKQFAGGGGESESKRIARHNLASQSNVDFSGANEVTMRGQMSWNADRTGITGGQPDPEHLRNREKAEAKADQKEEKAIRDKERVRKEIEAIDKRIIAQEGRVADARIQLADKVAKAQQKSAEDQVAAQRQIASESEKTFLTLAGVAENSAGRQGAAYKALFAVSKAFAIADASIQIADALAKSANMPFPMNVAAMASTAALTAGIVANIQAVTMAGHAKGGTQMGGYAWRHESGPEMAHAVVPTQIMQASHTTNNNSGGNIYNFNISGNDPALLRKIRNATTNGMGTSR